MGQPGRGPIYTWNTGQLIPGTAGITPGPGVDLSGWNTPGHQLEYAGLNPSDLTGATFANSDLANASFQFATLTDTNFGGAVIRGANLATAAGFTASQLYSTASYAGRDLTGIGLSGDLTGWNFANQNLTNAIFFRVLDINEVSSNLTNVDFSGAIVKGANLSLTTGFTASQLFSTASYASRDLTGIGLGGIVLTGWNFANQNLTNASFAAQTVLNANFTGAIIKGANFRCMYLTASQIYSTASYASGDLTGIGLGGDLTGWNFANQNLTNANFQGAYGAPTTLTNANFTGATIKGANFTQALAAPAWAPASFMARPAMPPAISPASDFRVMT